MEKLCIFGALLSAMVLVGCDRDVHVTNTSSGSEGDAGAGGAGGSGEIPPSEPETTTAKTFADGSGVIYGQMRDQEGDIVNVALSSANPNITKDALNGKLTLTVVPGTETTNGTKYTVRKTGSSSTSVKVEIDTQGEKLTKTGEYVAINELITGSHTALQSAGTPKTGSDLPKGSQRYEGKVIIRKNNNPDTQLSGAFYMGVDFTNAKVDYIDADAGTSDEKLIFKADSADDMTIDRVSGAFSTDSATIGLSNGATESASINGYFAGTGAEGVHGLAYSNDTQNYTGAFYGKKSQ
jgi:hypothetical protein